MIAVDGLVYEYPGKRALSDVSFSIAEGSITALVGPNGAGKTTLLRCIAALDEPFSGKIEVAGMNAAAEPRRIHGILGYLSDFFGVYNELTIEQCLTFAAWSHKLPRHAVRENVAAAAEMLGLSPYLSHRAGTLSRGWRQRLGIAQAIIHKPRLLLLDEPASGLDPEARLELSGLFRMLQRQGMTLLISSHILAELEDYCTGMLVLRGGRIVMHEAAALAQEAGADIHISFFHDADAAARLLRNDPHVTSLACEGQTIHFGYPADEEKQRLLLSRIVQSGAAIKAFRIGAQRLQDIYLRSAPKRNAPDGL